MSFGWIDSAGHVLVNNAGKPFYCEHCPCAPCLLAIEQRQKAKGITLAWSSGDPTNVTRLINTTGGTVYTLAQLKAYVNALCTGAPPAFYSGTYSGGASAPANWLPTTYANSATTVDELCALVAAMVTTVVKVAKTGTQTPTETWLISSGINTNTSFDLAWADAVANWPAGWTDREIAYDNWAYVVAYGSFKQSASRIETIYGTAGITLPTFAKSGTFYVYVVRYGAEFNNELFVENEWNPVFTFANDVTSKVKSTRFLPNTIPARAITEPGSRGYIFTTDTPTFGYAVIDWTFTA